MHLFGELKKRTEKRTQVDMGRTYKLHAEKSLVISGFAIGVQLRKIIV